MPKSKQQSATEWEGATPENMGEWETLGTGFAPLWKPEKGNAVVVIPTDVTPFRSKKGKKKVKGTSYAIACTLVGGDITNFYNGKGEATSITLGEKVTLGSSYHLVGEDKLIVVEKNGARLSNMAQLLSSDDKGFRITFNGQIKTGNAARKVNDFVVQVPKGYKEKFASTKGKF